MELALMAGKYVFVALIYLFVFMVYRGLLRQGSAAGSAPPARESRAQVLHRPAPAASARSAMQEALREEPASAASEPAAIAPPLPPEGAQPAPRAAPEPEAAAPEPQIEVAVGMPRLTVVHSETPELAVGREFPLLAAATLGRAEYNSVVVPDHFASTQHALIFLQEGRRVLRDRGSTNGTLLNGQKITGDMVLRDGDQVTVGTTVLKYTRPDPGTP